MTKQKKKNNKESENKIDVITFLSSHLICGICGFGVFWIYNLIGSNVFLSIFIGMVISSMVGNIFSIFKTIIVENEKLKKELKQWEK